MPKPLVPSENAETTWGYQAFSYTHQIQWVSSQFKERWEELNKWKTDFQNMTKEDLVRFSEAMENNWKSLLRKATELPDDGKKSSDFDPIKDVTEERLKERDLRMILKLINPN